MAWLKHTAEWLHMASVQRNINNHWIWLAMYVYQIVIYVCNASWLVHSYNFDNLRIAKWSPQLGMVHRFEMHSSHRGMLCLYYVAMCSFIILSSKGVS